MERAPTLFGYGKTTQAIAKVFGPSTFYDDKVNKPFTDKFGNHLKPSSEFDPRYSTLVCPERSELSFSSIEFSNSWENIKQFPRGNMEH